MEQKEFIFSPEQIHSQEEHVLVFLSDGSVVTCTSRSGDSSFLPTSLT
ncbi:hypothetical protein [Anaeromusa sp.]|mgnify:FL=1|jgi:hypothetical protein|nr:hypothetical protein [Anaeromusa sp.]MEA4836339.1 hypothetical protein [Anaeromusa sp.]